MTVRFHAQSSEIGGARQESFGLSSSFALFDGAGSAVGCCSRHRDVRHVLGFPITLYRQGALVGTMAKCLSCEFAS